MTNREQIEVMESRFKGVSDRLEIATDAGVLASGDLTGIADLTFALCTMSEEIRALRCEAEDNDYI